MMCLLPWNFFFFQAEDGIRDVAVTGVQTCALPICYMAPEQFVDAKRVDHLSDIYSLGRMLYELYSGHSVVAVQDLTALPVGIATLVERCTKTEPTKRFQNVKGLRTAFTSMVATKGKQTAGEKLRELLGKAITDTTLTRGDARTFADLIAQVQNDMDLLHDVCMELSPFAFEALWEVNQVVAKVLIKVFTDQVTSQGWPFDYTDKIGSACVRLHGATPDHEIRGMLVAAAVEVGASHNRWNVMDMAVSLLAQRKEPGEGLAVAHAVAPFRHRLGALADQVKSARLDPAIRDLFAEVEEEEGI